MTAQDVCRRAADLVGGDRARRHGDARAVHTTLVALRSAYLGTPITPRDVALMMVLLKVARTKTGAFNLDDSAGYAGITVEVAGRDA